MKILEILALGEEITCLRSPPDQKAILNAPVTWIVRVSLPPRQVCAVEEGRALAQPEFAHGFRDPGQVAGDPRASPFLGVSSRGYRPGTDGQPGVAGDGNINLLD